MEQLSGELVPGVGPGGRLLNVPQLQVAQLRVQYLEQSTVDRAIVSRQEAVICDLENQTEFQKVQMKRFEVPRTHELLGAGAGRAV